MECILTHSLWYQSSQFSLSPSIFMFTPFAILLDFLNDHLLHTSFACSHTINHYQHQLTDVMVHHYPHHLPYSRIPYPHIVQGQPFRLSHKHQCHLMRPLPWYLQVTSITPIPFHPIYCIISTTCTFLHHHWNKLSTHAVGMFSASCKYAPATHMCDLLSSNILYQGPSLSQDK